MGLSDLQGIFNPEAHTIKQIFTNADSYYQIPDYQRPYSWDDEHIEQLWDDLYDAVQSGSESYFLGPVILTGPHDGRFEVVDGQQRLTTLTILFCVLRDLYFQGDPKIRNAVQSLEEQKYRLAFRLANQPHVQNLFEQEILNGVKFPEKELTTREREQRKLINAALIFRDRLKEIEAKDGEIVRFVDYLLNRVIMITITCADRSYAVKLFQVLNARGLDLSPADLIKSELYGRVNKTKEQQFISDWRDVETVAQETEETLTLLFTYYAYYLLAQNPTRSLYEELTNQFKKRDPNQIIFEFKQFASLFQDIYQTDAALIYAFWYLPNQVFWKAILTSAKAVGFNDFDGLCRTVRNVFYAYWIAGYTTTKIKQLAFNLIAWVKKQRPLEEITADVERKMLEDSVVKRMRENLNDAAYGESWLKPLLVLIEYEQTDNAKSAYIALDQKLHVDHILPERWQVDPQWAKAWTEEPARIWLNKLGNLTLLSGKKNIAASNDSFVRKKQIYLRSGKTAFEISKPIIERAEWAEREVQERHQWLLDQAQQLFEINFDRLPPGPPAISSVAERTAESSQAGSDGEEPWVADGKVWHLEQRCGPAVKARLLAFDAMLRQRFHLDEPRWGQKYYIAYEVQGRDWVRIKTRRDHLLVDVRVRGGAFEATRLAEVLGLTAADPSSVEVVPKNADMDKVQLRLDEDYDLNAAPFQKFLEEAYTARPV